MLLDTLLAKATGMPGLELWRGLAPRRFLIDHLLADFIRATEILPADNANGLFAVITTSPLGLPQTLPEGWTEVESLGEYFATFRAPAGTTARAAVEALALEPGSLKASSSPGCKKCWGMIRIPPARPLRRMIQIQTLWPRLGFSISPAPATTTKHQKAKPSKTSTSSTETAALHPSTTATTATAPASWTPPTGPRKYPTKTSKKLKKWPSTSAKINHPFISAFPKTPPLGAGGLNHQPVP